MTQLTDALAKSKTLSFNGQEWPVSPLDFNDFADLEERLIELHPDGVIVKGEGGHSFPLRGLEALDLSKLKHQRIILWLALRKADPTLPTEYRERAQYKLTEVQVGRMLGAKALADPATVKFLTDVLMMSGVLPSPDDHEDAGDENDESKKTPPDPSV